MTPLSLCLLVAWAAEPVQAPAPRLYEFSPRLAAAIRAQSPDPVLPSGTTLPGVAPPGTPTPLSPLPGDPNVPTLQPPVPANDGYNPFQPPAVQDPFLFGPDPVLSSPDLGPPLYTGGAGPQPYRYGLIPRVDFGYIPQSEVKDASANIEMFEFNSEIRFTREIAPGWVYSSAPQFDYRAWNTDGTLGDQYRINLYRFGYDMQLATPRTGGWSFQFTFNPSINTDTEHQLTSSAWNFDGNVMGFYQIDPVWTLVIGAGYWQRVDDIVIPYAGVIITPDDRWELRLLFPKARITYFMGHFWMGKQYLYVSSEYHVESYQIDTYNQLLMAGDPRNRVQYEDWRLALGLRSDHGWFDKYIEVAWVLGRNLEFQHDLGKLDVGNNVLVRGGIRF